MKKIKKILIVLLLSFAVVLFIVNNNHIKASSKTNNEVIVNSIDEFQEALSRQKTNIKVSSIDFKGLTFVINYSVNIKGMDNTILSDVYFTISGPNVVMKVSMYHLVILLLTEK